MAPLPASIQNYTDEPRDLASYYGSSSIAL
jgi:hypothetical protein